MLVFGLRRKFDSDPRDIAFQTPNSLLDVPYAMAKRLLRITELRRFSEDNKFPGEHVEVDLIVLGLGRGIWGFIVRLVAIARLLLMMVMMMMIQRPLALRTRLVSRLAAASSAMPAAASLSSG